MIKRITVSFVIIFFLLSSAVGAQSSSGSVNSPNAPIRTWDVSFAPVAVALVCAFVFIGCYAIYLHRCADLELPDGDPTGAAANCCSSGHQGIDPKLLDTFPILVYSSVKHLKFGKATLDQCAVCLSEFESHDTLRLLPNCAHVFHPECIDAWLASHVTCPVCRSRVKPAEEHRRGEHEVVIVIPNEVINAHQVFDESSVSRTELNSGEGRSLGRCHSTGHCLGLGEIGGNDAARYSPTTLPEDVRKHILVSHGGMRRSASYDVLCRRLSDEESL
ncbi:E3 ubiquitin-protein ligase ATL6-like [Prosopis cineraria]|uniref:E3 ubiquitin-protein ligase ATL6-like n=1 Tax=Prosopis cineraria TaxID=364024 RepID=UPI0024106AC1|nr:E3 ubiquitin-protein ligase ATL6-like [Prosopis cineraria]